VFKVWLITAKLTVTYRLKVILKWAAILNRKLYPLPHNDYTIIILIPVLIINTVGLEIIFPFEYMLNKIYLYNIMYGNMSNA